MQAMILAAGRGERMRPLTDQTPKPLLPVAGRSLVARHLDALRQAHCRVVTINLAHLGQQLIDALGDGQAWGLQIRYAWEPEGALETAGGIATAQPWRGAEGQPFLLINGDVYTELDLGSLIAQASDLDWSSCDALLALVPNPAQHPQGDFSLDAHGRLQTTDGPDRLTYSGLGVYHPRLFAQTPVGQRAALGPLLRQAAQQGRLQGFCQTETWVDVGTPERLSALDLALRQRSA